MQTTTLTVDGMHCNGCVQVVQHVLEQHAGVKGVTVTLASKQARIAHAADQVSTEALAASVREAGYTVEPTA
ncbi:heavy-metal-associated domain-containing protein [Salinisphaera orenii]|uniref:heavy-metal-associated domain-containing protein n=1 Tax=Salinisphaera orenii TaxID=856731 RepID=UPI000DBE0529